MEKPEKNVELNYDWKTEKNVEFSTLFVFLTKILTLFSPIKFRFLAAITKI